MFLFFSARYRTCLWYSFYIIVFALFQASVAGFWNIANFPSWYILSSTPLFVCACVFFGGIFSVDFLVYSGLDINHYSRIAGRSSTYSHKGHSRWFRITGTILNNAHPVIASVFIVGIALSGILMIISVIDRGKYTAMIVNYLAPCFILFCIYAGMVCRKTIGRSAVFFAIASGVLTFGIVILALRNLTILPDNLFTAHVNLFSCVIEFIIIAITLVDRIALERKEKIAAKEHALTSDNLATQSRLQTLQAQINPHFLFNTLSLLNELIVLFPQRAEKLVERLSTLFRYTLTASNRKMVALTEEIAMIQTYLEIEKERFGQRLEYHIEVIGNPDNVVILGLIIQPIVENAIKHGISSLVLGGCIEVVCTITSDCIILVVHDSGKGFGSSRTTTGSGHGMQNIRERLALAYGAQGTLNVSNKNGGYVEISFPNKGLK